MGAWEHTLGGCESGFTLPDLTDTNIVWATCYGNEVTRYDARTKLARSVSPWLHTLDAAPDQVKYRCHWSPPLAIDPFDHNAVYYGCQKILRTTNGGMSWSEVSGDLSSQDPRFIVSSGGIVGDNLGQFYGEVVFSIAFSEIRKGLIWAGTNDGKVWYSPDGSKSWIRRHREPDRTSAQRRDFQNRAVPLRPGGGLYLRRLPPDGQPRSLGLQDHRSGQDLDQDQRRSAQRPSTRLRPRGGRKPQPEGQSVRRHR